MEIKRSTPPSNIAPASENLEVSAKTKRTSRGISENKDLYEIAKQPSVLDPVGPTSRGMTFREARNGLLDRWVNDSGFRQDMRRDPEGTVEKHGVILDDSSRTLLRQIDWSLSDKELAALAAKGDSG